MWDLIRLLDEVHNSLPAIFGAALALAIMGAVILFGVPAGCAPHWALGVSSFGYVCPAVFDPAVNPPLGSLTLAVAKSYPYLGVGLIGLAGAFVGGALARRLRVSGGGQDAPPS